MIGFYEALIEDVGFDFTLEGAKADGAGTEPVVQSGFLPPNVVR